MRKRLIQLLLGLMIIVGIAGFLGWQKQQAEAKVASRHGLSEAGVAFASNCKSIMDAHDSVFASGRDTLDGCGCIAATLIKSHPKNMTTAALIFEDMVVDSETGGDPDWETKAELSGVDKAMYFAMLFPVMDSLSSCAAPTQWRDISLTN